MLENILFPIKLQSYFFMGQTRQYLHHIFLGCCSFLTDWLFSSLGITVDKFGLIYFVDGTMIRRIDQNGIISTVLGSNDLTSARPLSCDSVMDISQVRQPFCLVVCQIESCAFTLSACLCASTSITKRCKENYIPAYFVAWKWLGQKGRSYKDWREDLTDWTQRISGERDFKTSFIAPNQLWDTDSWESKFH